MIYQRKEGFRYKFPVSLDAKLCIVNGGPQDTYENGVKILDISLGGAKVASNGWNIRYEHDPKQVILSFLLQDKHFSLHGLMIWKQLYLGEYLYGIQFQTQQDAQTELLIELKKCAREHASRQP